MAVATMKVPTIFYAVDRFSDVVSKMTRKTAAFGETAQAAAMRTSRTLNSAGTNMLSAGVGMAVGIGYAVNEAVKFEKAMANVDTTIDSFPGQIKAMGNSVLEMAKTMPVPISELTEALYDVVSAGIESKDAMMVLKSSSKLGVAGLGTAKEGVDVITSSLNAFNIKATESEKVANMVFKAVKYGKTTVSGIAESFGSSAALVKNSNVSLEEYLATTATLTTTGMTASRAQTQVSSAVTALIKPSGTMSKIFARLGVKDVPKWIKANGGLVNSMRIVRDEADRMGVLTSKAFGRKEGFSAMLSLLGPLSEKFKLVYGDMTGNVNSLDTAFEKQQKTVSAGVQRMKNSLTVLAIKIGDELIPRVNGFLDRISPIIDGTTKWMKENKGLANGLLNLTLILLALGAVAKILAVLFYGVSKAIIVVSAVIKAYTFVSTMAALANVGFATALWGCVTALWAFLWPIGLVVLAIGALIWIVIDMVQHWEDWRDVLLVMIGPLGQVWLLIEKIGKHWSHITSLFEGEGIMGAIKGIGLMLEDYVLGTLVKIFNIMGRIPLIGSPFKEMANDLQGIITQIPSEMPIGKLGMAGASNFQSFGGITPTWDVAPKPKNLAGKNTTDGADGANGKSGTLRVELIAPPGYEAKIDESQYFGIPVMLGNNQGSWNKYK